MPAFSTPNLPAAKRRLDLNGGKPREPYGVRNLQRGEARVWRVQGRPSGSCDPEHLGAMCRIILALPQRLRRQVGAARGRRERKRQANQVMRGISDHGLVEIADLNAYLSVGIGQGAKIASVAIAANPSGWSLRKGFRAFARPTIRRT